MEKKILKTLEFRIPFLNIYESTIIKFRTLISKNDISLSEPWVKDYERNILNLSIAIMYDS